MIAVYATLKVEPSDGPELERIVADLKAHVAAWEPDTLLYQLCRSRSAPGVYHMLELYADDEARARHESTDRYRAAAPRFTALLTEDLVLETFDAL